MTADLVEQLRDYGDVLRAEIERRESERRHGSGGAGRSWSRVLLVAAMVGVAVACGTALYSLYSLPLGPALVADPVEDSSSIERTDSEPAEFLDRLDDVDFVMEMGAGRDLTAGERRDVIDYFAPGTGAGQPSVGSARVAFELTDNWVVIDADLDAGQQPDRVPDDLPREQRCRVLARTDGDSLSFDALGHSCWDRNRSLLPGEGERAGVSYGCRPAVELGGLVAYGQGDFVADISVPPDSPGAIFTLVSGESVLIRPVEQQIIYAGPVVEQVAIFYGDGKVERTTTADCG